MTSTPRVRAHRARVRGQLSRSWAARIGPDMLPVLSAWSGIGLRWAPTSLQVELIRRASPTMALRLEAGALLRRLPRARATRAHPAVYNLVRSLLDGLAVLQAALAGAAAGPPPADGQPVGQAPPPARRLSAPAGGGGPPPGPPGGPGAVLRALLAAGLDPDLADGWDRGPRQLAIEL
jgi:hypothetical protein